MRRSMKHAKLLMVSALCLSLGIASIATAGQNVIGAYTTTSQAAKASSNYPVQKGNTDLRLLPAPGLRVLAALVGGYAVALRVAYDAGYAIGTAAHHVYNAITSDLVKDSNQLAMAAYDQTDFSQFD